MLAFTMSYVVARNGLVHVTLYTRVRTRRSWHELHSADLNDKGLVGNCAGMAVLQ
jgi:hypothetical protein